MIIISNCPHTFLLQIKPINFVLTYFPSLEEEKKHHWYRFQLHFLSE